MAHGNFVQLKKLISLLDYEYHDIYIHIDKKSNITNLEELKKEAKKSDIYIYKELKVYWGDYSQIETEFFLLKKATRKKYMYYHLLSGVDFPLTTPEKIYSFFKLNYGKEFINFSQKELKEEVVDRLKYYHFFLKHKNRDNNFFKILELISIFIQKMFRVNRIKKDEKIQKGANWFSITNNLSEYIISKEDYVKQRYKYTLCCDEVFMQSLVIDSPYKKKLYKYEYNDYKSIVRYIDWERGGPYTFQTEDYELLIGLNKEYFFARKFDEKKDNIIINKIYNYIKKGD